MEFTTESINILSMFWQFGLLALAISAITFVFKKVIEFFIISNPNVPLDKKSLFWRDVFLPILPIIIGGLFGYLIKTFPYPTSINEASSRMLFGLVAGMFSGVIYRMIKKFILARSGITEEEFDHKTNDTIIKAEVKIESLPTDTTTVDVPVSDNKKDVVPPQLS